MNADLIIENITIPEKGIGFLSISKGRLAAIRVGPVPDHLESTPRYDGKRALVLPGFVDGHIHLDKTLMGLPFIPHVAGETVAHRIEAEKVLRRSLDVPVEVRGGLLIETLSAQGTVAARSHVDIDSELKLSGLEAVLSLKQRYQHLIDLQVVAFPQSGILRDPGTAALLDAAIAAGADLVGGLDPAGIDGNIEGHLDVVFGVAEKRGVGIDLHLHDGGALGAFELRKIAERSLAQGMEGKVAVSHAFCLGELDDRDFGKTAEMLARAEISIMTTAPGSVSMPPVKKLKSSGVRVFCGSDNIRDAWSPFGNGDLLERAGLVCDRQDFRTDQDIELAFSLVTQTPSDVMGIGNGRLEIGAPADLVLLDATTVAHAVAQRPPGRVVFKNGLKTSVGP